MQPISCGAMVPELQCNPPEVLKGEVLKGEVLEKRLLLLFQQLLSFPDGRKERHDEECRWH